MCQQVSTPELDLFANDTVASETCSRITLERREYYRVTNPQHPAVTRPTASASNVIPAMSVSCCGRSFTIVSVARTQPYVDRRLYATGAMLLATAVAT